MTKFVDGIKSLFSGGPDTSEQTAKIEADNAKAREQQAISLDKQTESLQAKDTEQDQLAGRALRAPKGRRLLLAATGEQGLSSKLNG